MEAHKNYYDFNELVSSITRIANNLDEMTEIMTTKKVPEKAKDALNEWYGSMVMDTVRDKFLSANEIGKKDDEIQDLKLENDRLKQRNELMEDFIHAIACTNSKKSKYYGLCDDVSCPYYDHDRGCFEGACQLGSRQLIEKEAADIIDKLEEL